MADDLIAKLGDLLKEKPWYELPRFLGSLRLVEMRQDLREKNLHDTEEPPMATTTGHPVQPRPCGP